MDRIYCIFPIDYHSRDAFQRYVQACTVILVSALWRVDDGIQDREKVELFVQKPPAGARAGREYHSFNRNR